MVRNHHIAVQLAAERQRDLLAAAGGWRLSGRFARSAGERAPVRGSDLAPVVAEVRFPDVSKTRELHLPDPRIRRNPAGQSAAWAPASRRHRDARGSGRVGS